MAFAASPRYADLGAFVRGSGWVPSRTLSGIGGRRWDYDGLVMNKMAGGRDGFAFAYNITQFPAAGVHGHLLQCVYSCGAPEIADFKFTYDQFGLPDGSTFRANPGDVGLDKALFSKITQYCPAPRSGWVITFVTKIPVKLEGPSWQLAYFGAIMGWPPVAFTGEWSPTGTGITLEQREKLTLCRAVAAKLFILGSNQEVPAFTDTDMFSDNDVFKTFDVFYSNTLPGIKAMVERYVAIIFDAMREHQRANPGNTEPEDAEAFAKHTFASATALGVTDQHNASGYDKVFKRIDQLSKEYKSAFPDSKEDSNALKTALTRALIVKSIRRVDNAIKAIDAYINSTANKLNNYERDQGRAGTGKRGRGSGNFLNDLIGRFGQDAASAPQAEDDDDNQPVEAEAETTARPAKEIRTDTKATREDRPGVGKTRPKFESSIFSRMRSNKP